jgi:hypothetical protein
MKEINLTKGFVTQVDDEDYEFLNQWKWCVCEGKRVNYAVRNICRNDKKLNLGMHRVIMNTPIDMQVDHIDHNGLNNQKSNMRNCKASQNQYNKRPFSRSGYKGVYYINNYIVSQILINKKVTHLGSYKTEEEAAKSYDKKAKELHGEFALLNFKESES